MTRPATSGTMPLANMPAFYYKASQLWRTQNEPAAIDGHAVAGSFSRSATTRNLPDANGWRKPSPYSGTLTTYEWFRISYAYRTWTNFEVVNSYYPGISNISGMPKAYPLCCSSHLSLARNKALLELKNQSINLSLAFKERQQTVDLVTSCARRALNIVKSFKRRFRHERRRRRPPPGSWKDIPDFWLEYRYAVLPTMLDAYGAVEALEKRDNGTYDRYRCTVRGKSSYSGGRKQLSSQSREITHYNTVTATVKEYLDELKYGARVRYDACLVNPLYLTLSEVGVTNPLEVVWEATTLSFVADWFLSIGDFLSAIDATLPFRFLGGSETTYLSWKGSTSITGPVQIVSSGKGSHTAFDRTVVYSFPFPDPFVLKENPINLTRLADALALLSGAFQSR